jgi:lysozyme
MSLTRRQFLGTAAGTAAAAMGVGNLGRADGPDYAVQGIDVSRWQGNVNWPAVKQSGIKFCFCKASEGVPGAVFGPPRNGMPVDPQFATNWPAIKAQGILRGAYHYVRPGMGTAKDQADHFLDTVLAHSPGGLSGDLRPVLDVENNEEGTVPPAQMWQFVKLMVSRIKSRIGRAPFIYCNNNFWVNHVGNPLSNLDCPLWFARWGPTTDGFIPRAWSTWTFWQYSSTGRNPGVNNGTTDVDLDCYNGTLEGMNRFRMP